MPNSKKDELTGEVLSVHGNNQYVVRVENEGQSADVLCYLSGRMTRHKINVLVGDTVRLVCPPPYNRGRITFREK